MRDLWCPTDSPDCLAAEYRAEIKRLQTALDDISNLRDEYALKRKSQAEEIERLRADNLILSECESETWRAMKADNDRLRSALHWTAQNCLDQACVRRAMDAVGPATG